MKKVNSATPGISCGSAKETWEIPELHMIRFSCTDVICTSGDGDTAGRDSEGSYGYDRADWFSN